MRRVKIILPAVATDLGPGLDSLALALSLRCTVELIERKDETLLVETEGEGAGAYGLSLRHPVVLALMRMFQRQEQAPLGLTIKISNLIPPDSGLGVDVAYTVAGIIGANNLLGNVYTRQDVISFAAEASGQPHRAAAAILGGLTATILEEKSLISRSLPVERMMVVLVVPEIEDYRALALSTVPERVTMGDAAYNLSRLPLFVEGLRVADYDLLTHVMDDKLRLPYLRRHISGYDHVLEMTRRAGAQAFTLSGGGPSLIIFAAENHKKIAQAAEEAFRNSGITARVWVLPIDTQGVVVSVAQSM